MTIKKVAVVFDDFNRKAVMRITELCNALTAMGAGVVSDADIMSAEVILVLGGDGFMLKTINRYYGLNVPFLGINFGRKGFLLNNDRNNIVEMIMLGKYKISQFPLLKVSAFLSDGTFQEQVSANDIYTERLTPQCVRLGIKINDLDICEIMADGLAASMPLGSTAYNLSTGGSVVHPALPAICLSSINEVWPKRLPPLVLPLDTKISIEVIEAQKRKARVTSGEVFSFEDVSHVVIENSGQAFFLVLLDGEDFLKSVRDKLIRR